MTWLAPWALVAGALGMLGVVAAHLLARQRPRAIALATTRFLPDGMLDATSIQPLPRDRWWMLLRMLIVALAAAGVAQPVLTGARVPAQTVLLLDRTLPDTVQRQALSALAPTDVVIPYDSVATLTPATAVTVREARQASLSAALARLLRVRDSLARRTDAVRVVAASPFDPGSVDAVTRQLRAQLRDSIHVLALPAPVNSMLPRSAIAVRDSGDDPIAATALLLGDSVAAAGTTIVRLASLSAADSAAAVAGGTIIWWPPVRSDSAAPLRAITIGARSWIASLSPPRDAPARAAGERAVGWWNDGAPAIWRRDTGEGCLLRVSASVPAAGDQTLTLAAQVWLAALVTSCDRRTRQSPPPPWLQAPDTTGAAVPAPVSFTSGLAPWLLGAALAAALLELLLRLRSQA